MSIIIWHVKYGLNFIGVWPGVPRHKVLFVLIGLFLTNLIFQIWNAAMVFKQLDLLMNNLGTVMPVTSVVLKLLVFRTKYRSINIVISEMMEDWKNVKTVANREVMINNMKLAAYLSNAISVTYNGLVLSYVVIAVFSYTSESTSDRQFVMQAHYPFIDSKKTPLFELLCLLQWIIAFFGANGHAVMEGLMAVSVLHANTKAEGVCREITEFSEICQTATSREHILKAKDKLIAKHVNFINYTEYIQDIYSYVSFFHLFVMTLINCIVGFMLISLTGVNQETIFTLLMCIAYILTALSAVASYCIAGEYLTAQGVKIFEALCTIPWYKFRPDDTRILIFMIMRSRQPATITAGNFGNLSLVYFTQIIKTSFSYLSVVRAASN